MPPQNVLDEYDKFSRTLDDFNKTIQLESSRKGNDNNGRIYAIEAVAVDLAGNQSSSESAVLVPHDRENCLFN